MKWLISHCKYLRTMLWWLWHFREAVDIVVNHRTKHLEEMRELAVHNKEWREKIIEQHREHIAGMRAAHESEIQEMGNVVELAKMLQAIGISLDEPVEDFEVFNQSVSRGCYSCDVSYRQGDVETGFHLVSVNHWEGELSECETEEAANERH